MSRNTLANEDWRELAELLPLRGAPGLHQAARQQFRTLFESIGQPSGAQGVGRQHDVRLSHIETNDGLAQFGFTVRLIGGERMLVAATIYRDRFTAAQAVCRQPGVAAA